MNSKQLMNQDELWNEVVAKIAAANIMKVAPADVSGITDWKQKVIAEIQSKFVLTLKDPMPNEDDYQTGGADASGEVYDMTSSVYYDDLKAWRERNNKCLECGCSIAKGNFYCGECLCED